MRLFWRVFLLNAALLLVAGIVLAFSPLRISTPAEVFEEVVVGVGILLLLGADYALLRPTFKPLERLVERMKNVDLLRPGLRLAPSGPPEVVDLMHAFNEMLERLETERRESGGRVLAAQEAERKRIAAELHDEVGQSMTGVLLTPRPGRGRGPPGGARCSRRRRRRRGRASRRCAGSRRSCGPSCSSTSASSARSSRSRRASPSRPGLELEWDFARELPQLSPDAELAVYRVAQESLTNVARHAGAVRVRLSLQPGHDSVVLRVVDDGGGIERRARTAAACAACASARSWSGPRSRSSPPAGVGGASRSGSRSPRPASGA